MPEDKLLGFYNVLKQSGFVEGLPSDYNTFKSGLSNSENAKGFYEVIKAGGVVEGLPDTFEDFSFGLGLGKPATVTEPGAGGGLPLDITPGKEAGVSQLDIQKELFKGAGVEGIPEGVIKSTITPAEYQLFVGKGAEPTITLGKGYKKEPTALEQQIEPKLDFEKFKYTDKFVLNPFPTLAERLNKIDEYGDEDVKKMEKAKVFDDLIKYKNEQTIDYKKESEIINQNLQQNLAQANEIANQMQDPTLTEQDKNQLNFQAESLQLNIANSQNRLNDLQSLYNDNLKFLNTLTSARKSMQFNYNSALELGVTGMFNATVPSLLKGLGNLFEFETGIGKDLTPEEYKQYWEYNPLRAVGKFLQLGAEAIEIPVDTQINTDLQKELTSDVNSRNLALFTGQVLGSFATTMATGGYGAALQSFGTAYDFGKQQGLNDSQSGLFALPIAVVAGYVAPYGTEKFAKILTSASGKQSLKSAIDLMKSNPNASYKKALEIGKEWGKSVVQEAAEGGAERATEELQKATFTALTDKDLYGPTEGKDFKSIVKRVSLASAEEGVGGAIISTLVAPFAGYRFGQLSNIVAKSLKNPSNEIDFLNDLNSLYEGGQISQNQYQEVNNLFEKAKQTVNQIPKDIKDESAIARSVQLIMSQKDIEEQLKTVNPAMSGELKTKLDKINEELGRIAGGEIPQAAPDLDAVTQGKVPATEPAPTEAVPVEEVKAEVTVAEPLKDVPNTTDALNKKKTELGESSDTWQSVADLVPKGSYGIVDGVDTGKTISDVISETYHADKAAEKETELTKAVEELLAKPTEAAVTPEAAPTEAAAQPTLEDFDVINMTSVKGRKAREELKARVGVDAYKKMDMVNKKFNDVIKDLENKGILRKECP